VLCCSSLYPTDEELSTGTPVLGCLSGEFGDAGKMGPDGYGQPLKTQHLSIAESGVLKQIDPHSSLGSSGKLGRLVPGRPKARVKIRKINMTANSNKTVTR